MKAVSLFSGAGGFEIGFERAGIETVLQVEMDPWCQQVLERHWPEVQRVDDVCKVDTSTQFRGSGDVLLAPRRADVESQRHANGTGRAAVDGGIDLIYGGFPCQDVSVAGKRAGLSGERSGLWFEFRRIVSELRPHWVVIENVPGLLSSNSGRDFATILLGLEELGYGWAYRVLDARWFGVPQRRRRVLIVGCAGDAAGAASVLAVCESCGGHPAPSRQEGQGLAYALNASVRGTGNAWNSNYVAGTLGSHHGNVRADQAWTGQLLPTLAPGAHPGGLTGREADNGALVVAGAQRASDGHHGHSSPRGDGADNLIAFDWQASAGNDDSWRGKGRQHVVRSGDYAGANSATRVDAIAGSFGVRRLTPRECERLMGWPDDWTRFTADGQEIPDSHRYRLCGNGVVSVVAEWLGHRLVAADRPGGTP